MKYFLILLSIIILINSKTINEDITINFSVENQYISDENGVFSASSNYTDKNDFFNSSDIEEKTAFQMEISGSIKTYSLKCRLFKGEGKAIILICNFEEGLQKNEIIRIIKTYNIQYKTYNISAEFNVENCRLYKASYNIPFLYSSEQTINIQENQNKINVEFKFESYYNEPLILENHLNNGTVPLENCIKDGKILKCEI